MKSQASINSVLRPCPRSEKRRMWFPAARQTEWLTGWVMIISGPITDSANSGWPSSCSPLGRDPQRPPDVPDTTDDPRFCTDHFNIQVEERQATGPTWQENSQSGLTVSIR